MWAPLPVGVENAAECLREIAAAMDDLKKSGQAVGAQVLTNLAGFAPPTILSQAARLQARQRFFNLVVTNVPGPQFPLYLLGRRLRGLYPVVPLARRQALGMAVMSYDGHLGFGLLGDYDALPELESIAAALRQAIAALSRAAGIPAARRAHRKAPARRAAVNGAAGAKAVTNATNGTGPAAGTTNGSKHAAGANGAKPARKRATRKPAARG
jgi:diacylglycerol O-acyltransferase / wax synthase